ncbi:MAG: alpha-glucosidase [Clostridiales bacterium]|nr:alpha-glucosidase [Clostridiales bacterium]
MERHWWQKEVIYQIYPKSFYDSNHDGIGDIRGITEKLPYLENLGVTMLWICPVYQSPMDDNGYDVSDYRALAPEFGSLRDLDELIGEAKRRGIKIIMDLVINHSSDEHEWFQKAISEPDSKYHDYYIFKEGKKEPNNWRSVFGGSVWEKVPGRDEYYYHTFGKKQPDLNWENRELREELYDMVNWWLDKGIAGFRIDAISYIKKDLTWKDREPDGADGLAKCSKASRNQLGIEVFLKELKEKTFDRHPCVTVAEAAGVPYEKMGEFIGDQGFFDMIFDFRYADLDIASGNEWFHRISWTVKDLKDKMMKSQSVMQEYGWAANFIENHDQPRAASKYLGSDQNDANAVKMLGAMYFFLRGVPFVYQGQELGMVNFQRKSMEEFDDISSIGQYQRSLEEGFSEEAALNIVNLRSRDNSRTPFPWNDEKYGGFSETKPWIGMTEEYPAINAAAQIEKEGSVLEFYKEMIAFRQNGPYHDTLVYGDIEPLEICDHVIAYRRYREKEAILCLFNFANDEALIRLEEGEHIPVWGNLSGTEIKGNEIRLQPYQALLINERTENKKPEK